MNPLHKGRIDPRQGRLAEEWLSWFGALGFSCETRHESHRGRPFFRMKVILRTRKAYQTLREEFDSFIGEGAMRDCTVYLDKVDISRGEIKATCIAPVDGCRLWEDEA